MRDEDQAKALAIPKTSRKPHDIATRMHAIMEYAVSEKRRDSGIRYVVLVAQIRARFRCSLHTAERAIHEANEQLRLEFQAFCQDAPRIIFESYIEIKEEQMRAKQYTAARRTLDSLRDMFGLKSAINVNVNLGGNAIAASAFENLDDDTLAALAKLDQLVDVRDANVIDVPTIADAMELTAIAIDAIDTTHAIHVDDREDDEGR